MSDWEDYQEPGKLARVPANPFGVVVSDGSGAFVPALLSLAARTTCTLLLCSVHGCPSHVAGCQSLALLAARLILLCARLWYWCVFVSGTDACPSLVLMASHLPFTRCWLPFTVVLPSGYPPLSDSASCSQWWLPFSGTADSTGLVNLALLTPHTVHDDFRMIYDNSLITMCYE